MRHVPPVMNHQDSRARAEEAYRLRAVGRTWQEVADELGFKSHGAAQLAVARLHKRNPAQSTETVRRSASEGLRIVRAVLFERFADAKVREDNNDLLMLAKELRNNISESAKLHGAHAPQRTEVDVTVSSASEAIDQLERQLLAIVAQRQPLPARGAVIEGEVLP